MNPGTEFDILDMPFEGLAAYWLSIKKILVGRKGKSILEEERKNTEEPYIKYLLDTVFSKMEINTVRNLAAIRRDTLLSDYEVKLRLMRATAAAAASNENPRRTFVTFLSYYSTPPLTEKQAFDLVGGMISGLSDPATDLPVLVGVDHKLKHEQLVVKLLFYQLQARREGKEALGPLVKHSKSAFFKEAVNLLLDGFDPSFLDRAMRQKQRTLLADTARKMNMALDMAIGIREKLSYDDIFTIARAYLP